MKLGIVRGTLGMTVARPFPPALGRSRQRSAALGCSYTARTRQSCAHPCRGGLRRVSPLQNVLDSINGRPQLPVFCELRSPPRRQNGRVESRVPRGFNFGTVTETKRRTRRERTLVGASERDRVRAGEREREGQSVRLGDRSQCIPSRCFLCAVFSLIYYATDRVCG